MLYCYGDAATSSCRHTPTLASLPRHAQVLDYQVTTDTGTCSSRARAGGQRSTSSNLRKVDLSYNSIETIGSSLSHHSNLQELLLAENGLQHIGSGLEPLTQLRRLDLCSNSLRTCEGLQGGSDEVSALIFDKLLAPCDQVLRNTGFWRPSVPVSCTLLFELCPARRCLVKHTGLCSLQELSLDGNSISKLQPLSGLPSLHELSIAHNRIACLDGIEVGRTAVPLQGGLSHAMDCLNSPPLVSMLNDVHHKTAPPTQRLLNTVTDSNFRVAAWCAHRAWQACAPWMWAATGCAG